MGYAAISDPLLNIAFYSGLVVSVLTLVLVLAIALLRFVTDRRRQREMVLKTLWQPVFVSAALDMAFTRPTMLSADRHVVLLLWIHYTESVRGEAREHLRRLALDLGLDIVAREFLHGRNRRRRLMGVVALGRLKSAADFNDLAAMADEDNPVLSLQVLRSLVQIDPVAGLPLMLERLVERDDYPMTKLVAMLKDVPGDLLAAPLLDTLASAPLHVKPRLLGLLRIVNVSDNWPILESLLQMAQPVDVLVAALRICQDPRALPAIRCLTTHEHSSVRALAAAALGRLGNAADGPCLQAMMADSQWWVRYRATQALAGLPGMTRQKLLAIQANTTDRFAVEMLSQVLAETTMMDTP